MTSIRDVAKKAGVSVGTVSRVMNGDAHVADQTRNRVRKVISALEYKPNPSARALRSNRTDMIALSLPELVNPFYAAVVEGVQREIETKGLRLILCGPHKDPDREPEELDLLVNRHVDGLIVVPQRFSQTGERQNELVRLSGKGHAIVSLGQIIQANSPSLDSIVTDMSIGMRQAIEHLLQLGHRRIAYFGPPEGVAEIRLQLFRSMLAEHRVKADNSLIFHVDPTAEQGFRLAECVLKRRSKPTAIVAVNDMVAIGAMMAFQEHGLTLPDHMSIIGIDDLPFASIVRPKLTTIHQPKNELGSLAAKRLLGRINREFCQYRVISLPTRLIVRDSTAHAPSQLPEL